MPAVPFDLDERAIRMTRRIEDAEAKSRGATIAKVRPDIAERAGLLPGTLENLRKGRVKGVAGRIYLLLRRVFIKQLQSELRALLHEFDDITSTGIPLDSDEASAVRESIAAIRAALDEKSGGEVK
jgi:hypothetical protein